MTEWFDKVLRETSETSKVESCRYLMFLFKGYFVIKDFYIINILNVNCVIVVLWVQLNINTSQ